MAMVAVGQVVGKSDTSGCACRPHLHLGGSDVADAAGE